MRTGFESSARDGGKPVLYPYLLGLYPVVHLAASNADRMPIRYAILPAGICFVATAVPFLVLARLTSSATKAGLTVVSILLFFYGYGYFRMAFFALGRRVPPLQGLSDHRFLWPLFLTLLVFTAVKTVLARRSFEGTTAPLNLFATAITLAALAPFVGHVRSSLRTRDPVRLRLPSMPPDVYYIVLDAYGSEGVLKRHYAFDNSSFLRALEKQGFVVSSRSRSNYMFTLASLASSLNMDYLYALRPKEESSEREWLTRRSPLPDLIDDNRVAESFKGAGYRYVDLPSGLSFTNQSRIADVNFGSEVDLREFNSMLGQTTMLSPWIGDQFEQVSPSDLINLERKLLSCPALPGPKFVFAHFLSPHPPYQFNADGSLAAKAPPGVLLEWSNHRAYIQQVQYLNDHVLRAVKTIIARSSVPPIIILQGDHGPALRDETSTQSSLAPWGNALWNARSGNLTACLVPPSVRRQIPADLSPVNIFRIVFRKVYKAQLPLRENASYYSEATDIYRFSPIPRTGLEPLTRPQGSR